MAVEEHRDAEPADDKDQLIEKLFDEYGGELKRLAYLYIHDRAMAEDILQEVFLSCYKNLDRFRKESSYKTWLVRITVNKSKDALKKWSFRNLTYRPPADLELIEHGTPEKEYLTREVDLELVEKVMKLPVKLKEVIILFYYQELTLEEMSKVLDINVNTVKTRLYRARKKIGEAMEEGEDNEAGF